MLNFRGRQRQQRDGTRVPQNGRAEAKIITAPTIVPSLALAGGEKFSPYGAWLDEPIGDLTGQDPLTPAQHCQGGVLIYGQPGSGKTQGPLAQLVRWLMRWKPMGRDDLRPGFIVPCIKSDFADAVERWAVLEGRGGDVIRVRLGGPWRINLLDYASQIDGGETENLTELLVTIGENQLSPVRLETILIGRRRTGN